MFACGKKAEQTKVESGPITESVYASGLVKSKNQYQVFSTVNGLVEELLVHEGDLVKRGDPIIRLSNEASKLNAENAQLASNLAYQNTKGEKLKELQMNIDFANSKLKIDSLMYVRQQNLWASQIGSKVELEQKELLYKNSQTNYATALLRYSDAKKNLQVSAEQAQNQALISAKFENDFLIKSETNGRVYSILKEKGELVTSLTPIATIGDANDFMIELQVDEYDITKIKPSQKIFISLDSYKGQVFEALVTKVNTIMNERTRSFNIEANFTNKPDQLFPNLSIEANIVIQSKANALTIPRYYLVNDSMVINQNQESIKVKVGLKDFKKVEILNGLKQNDIILKPGK
jgi:multidrug efflux pump subunit AcrA (membrane-fusion protein)